MGEFLRQIQYKAEWFGVAIVEASQWYPSTKTCSECGSIQDMPLGDREYVCSDCGFQCGRDLNAALNLRALAVGSTERLNVRGA